MDYYRYMTSTPAVFTGDLDSLGIDEVEPWVCEDTSLNRRLLRGAGLMWEPVKSETGEPTGLIRSFSPQALTERRDSVWERRKPIMVDPTNRFSEYVGPDEYPLDFDVPFWLAARLRWWDDDDRKGVPESERRPFPTRCDTVRNDGTRCWNWAMEPRKATRCKQHLPWAADLELRNAQIARHRLLQAGPDAADTLEHLATSAESEPVRLKAATEILDRIGVRGGVEIDARIEVEQVDPSIALRERLARLRDRAMTELEPAPPVVIEAEVVTDEP